MVNFSWASLICGVLEYAEFEAYRPAIMGDSEPSSAHNPDFLLERQSVYPWGGSTPRMLSICNKVGGFEVFGRLRSEVPR